MAKAVEFYFDIGSPASYLAWTQLPALLRRTGATLLPRPILLGGLFKAVGNASPIAVPAKGRYMARDFARFAARYGVPFTMAPAFPVNTLPLMRGATALLGTADFERYVTALFHAFFGHGLDIGSPDIVRDVLADAGLESAAIARRAEEPAVKEALKAQTEAAAQRGCFGAPSFFVGETLFFGQDRLDAVAEALAALP